MHHISHFKPLRCFVLLSLSLIISGCVATDIRRALNLDLEVKPLGSNNTTVDNNNSIVFGNFDVLTSGELEMKKFKTALILPEEVFTEDKIPSPDDCDWGMLGAVSLADKYEFDVEKDGFFSVSLPPGNYIVCNITIDLKYFIYELKSGKPHHFRDRFYRANLYRKIKLFPPYKDIGRLKFTVAPNSISYVGNLKIEISNLRSGSKRYNIDYRSTMGHTSGGGIMDTTITTYWREKTVSTYEPSTTNVSIIDAYEKETNRFLTRFPSIRAPDKKLMRKY